MNFDGKPALVRGAGFLLSKLSLKKLQNNLEDWQEGLSLTYQKRQNHITNNNDHEKRNQNRPLL